jgi:tRNA (guanine-N7-)-methyltransferase
LFPCPWPKDKHERYRLFSQRFLWRLNGCIKHGGTVQVVTDDEGYFYWILKESVDTGFSVSYETVGPGFFTKYESKWRQAGKNTFYRIIFTKEIDYPLHTPEEVVLQTYRILSFDPQSFSPIPLRGEIVVEFKDFLYDPIKQRAMVRALVVEDEFLQDFWIEVRYSGKDWIIRPYEGCGWIPTAGTQKALDLVYAACTKGAP